nr:AbrB family transcriptional regulator [Klebsiella pneumoniae]
KCALMGPALSHILQTDFITAYLASCPVVLYSLAIMAEAPREDLSFIMALLRLVMFIILLTVAGIAVDFSMYGPGHY